MQAGSQERGLSRRGRAADLVLFILSLFSFFLTAHGALKGKGEDGGSTSAAGECARTGGLPCNCHVCVCVCVLCMCVYSTCTGLPSTFGLCSFFSVD